ncbi:MraY family glycosyltransferase [Halpernia sp.]|uniref:MraY family glycosyltransferase n=1 Tax=Halpernia sp. TaxID=2782209 RepID=UPI003A9306AA
MILYLVLVLVLLIIMFVYFKIANKYNIIDKPNERSSHSEITLRGGGIIFPVAFLFLIIYKFFFSNNQDFLLNYWQFGLGLFLISAISFIDDVMDLSNKIRILFHFISVGLLLYFINAFQLLPIWAIPILFILIIGILNAFNFMDGINGITGFYSLAVLAGLLYVNQYIVSFTDINFIIFPIIASLVFLFFNFRKKAKCFMGDIGSMAIAFWILSLLGLLILKTNELKYLLFLTIYGIDTIVTILERLKLKENIFKAHRRHLYQLFANEKNADHRIISLIYAFLQTIVNVIVIKCDDLGFWMFPIIILPLSFFYILLKLRIHRTIAI